jgi:glycosyltransferase involved in cell wall biosynthesis/peptidoglycan/xylan/chitin deacetylase (PgdA/CDA1 family)
MKPPATGPGTLLLSFDCEGKFGMADRINPELARLLSNRSNSGAYTAILRVLERHGMRATFAFVGAFTLHPDELAAWRHYLPEERVGGRPWLEAFFAAERRGDFDGWLNPEPLRLVRAAGGHEIGTHGFSHLPLAEAVASAAVFDREIGAVCALARARGEAVHTLVYPGNQLGHTARLTSHGVQGYRDALDSTWRGPSRRAANVLREFNLAEPAQPHATGGPVVAIPAGHILNFRHGLARRLVPRAVTRRRWRGPAGARRPLRRSGPSVVAPAQLSHRSRADRRSGGDSEGGPPAGGRGPARESDVGGLLPVRGAQHMKPGKVILVVTEDWYFLSHRLAFARFLREGGWDVLVATRINTAADAARIRQAGLRLVLVPVERGRLVSPGDLRYLWRLVRLYFAERPDVVHHVAMKPVLYGSVAAAVVRTPGVVNAIAGMGYLFTGGGAAVRLVRTGVLGLFRLLFSRKRARVVLQNAEDAALFSEKVGLGPQQVRLIRGAGVRVEEFVPATHGLRREPVVLLVARMLRDKGVREFVAAARTLRAKGVPGRFVLVGSRDPQNPNSLSSEELAAIVAAGEVEWLGQRSDIAELYARADIAVLPSYREGLPKSLLEAAAAGLPIVATDTSGCREVVDPGRNGLLVPVGDSAALAEALERLLRDADLRARWGAASRQRAEREFHEQVVFKGFLQVYEEVRHA